MNIMKTAIEHFWELCLEGLMHGFKQKRGAMGHAEYLDRSCEFEGYSIHERFNYEMADGPASTHTRRTRKFGS